VATVPVERRGFRRTLAFAVVAPPVAAVALAAVFLWQIERLLEQEKWVRHSDQVIALTNQTEKQLLWLQSNVRGYLLTGHAFYHDRYRAAHAEAPRSVERLARLVADNPPQVRRAEHLASLVERLRAAGAALVQLREAGGDYRGYIADPSFVALLEERDRAFGEFIGVEEGLRAERSARATGTTRGGVGASLGVAAILGIATGVAAQRTLLRLSATYQGALDEAERGRAELARRVNERTAQLQDVVGQLEAFNYTVSHDLRAPLRAMQGFSQALGEDHADALGDRGQMYVRRIAAAAQRMDEMIQDLLDYSRLGRSELPLAPVDLGAVVDEALAQVAPRRGADFHVRRPLPAVVAHRPTLARVVVNLLTNAAKFVQPGGRAAVHVGAMEDAGRVRLWVRDNGIGIASEHHQRIFNVFERLHGSEEFPGTGIGLAMVRLASERMRGSCGVESEPGKGSAFWVEFAAADVPVPAPKGG
jgi:signal transduction histidine kinase